MLRINSCITLLVMVWGSSVMFADDTLHPDRHSAARAVLDANRPFGELFKDFSDPSKRKLASVNQQLLTVADVLHDSAIKERFHPNAFDLLMYEPLEGTPASQTIDRERIAGWRRQILELTPQIVEYLAETETENWTPLVDILLLVDPSGAALRREEQRLLKDDSLRLLVYSKMLGFSIISLPRDRSVLAPIIKELGSQDDVTLGRWNGAWKEIRGKELDTQAAMLAVLSHNVAGMITLGDRVQAELPHLAALLNRNQPPIFRKVSLLVMSSLGEEALPCQGAVRQQFRDQDPLIRLLAAQAVVEMNPGTADIVALENEANLKGEELAWFRESYETKNRAGAVEGYQNVQGQPLDEKQTRAAILAALRSHHQFFFRRGLRDLIKQGEAGRFARREVEAVLLLRQLDDETRRLGTLAIKTMDGK